MKTKDAIVDRFRQDFRRRPNVDLDTPDIQVNLHIAKENCTLSIDSSGKSLHKRGYRTESVDAPINEVLSAGLILLSGWKQDCNFIDPMCGSGTNLIEAALLAYNIPPQMHRKRFGFTTWKDYDADLWKQVVEEAQERKTDFQHSILGFDRDFKAVRISQWNTISAKVDDKIQMCQRLHDNQSLEYQNHTQQSHLGQEQSETC